MVVINQAPLDDAFAQFYGITVSESKKSMKVHDELQYVARGEPT